jgi:hypothetical protein
VRTSNAWSVTDSATIFCSGAYGPTGWADAGVSAKLAMITATPTPAHAVGDFMLS